MHRSQAFKILRGVVRLIPVYLLSIAIIDAQETENSQLIADIVAASEAEVIQSLPSPDENFVAEVTVYPCVEVNSKESSYERLDLLNNSTGEKHLIAEQVINCGGLGAYGLWATRWSVDSSYLYYTDAREGTPDGFAAAWSPPLWRVETANVQVESLGQAQFSPNGNWIAAWGQGQIQIIATNSDERMRFEQSPAELQIFEMSWLPDNSGIIYIQADMLFGPVSQTTVTHIDLETETQTILLDTAH